MVVNILAARRQGIGYESANRPLAILDGRQKGAALLGLVASASVDAPKIPIRRNAFIRKPYAVNTCSKGA